MDLNSCRVCLQAKKSLMPLHKNRKDGSLADQLEFCMNVPIIRDNNLPQNICTTCLAKLKTAYDLKTEFIENNEFLKNLYQNLEDFLPSEEIYLEIEEVDLKHEADVSNDQSISDFESPLKDDATLNQFNTIELVQVDKGEAIDNEITEYWPDISLPKMTRSKSLPKKNICYICDQEFETNRKKNNHIADVHEKLISHVCPVCNYVSGNAKFMDSHIRKHREEATFVCEYCSAAFIEMKTLTRHTQVVHAENKDKTLPCNKCDKKFPSVTGLQRHQKNVHDVIIMHCDLCRSSFRKKVALIVHMANIHGGIAPIQCETCKNFFKTNSTLIKHQSRYNGLCENKFFPRVLHGRYQCPYCPRIYTNRSEFVPHVNSHENRRDHVCTNGSCTKSFLTKTALRLHISMCENLRLFQCESCEKRFNTQKSKENHVKIYHSTERPFACTFCDSKFALKKSLLRHLSALHKQKSKRVAGVGKCFIINE